MQELDIGCNGIGDKGINELAAVVANNESLTILNLADVRISNESISDLVEVCRKFSMMVCMRSLCRTSLIMQAGQMKDPSGVVQGLNNNTSLQIVVFSHKEIKLLDAETIRKEINLHCN